MPDIGRRRTIGVNANGSNLDSNIEDGDRNPATTAMASSLGNGGLQPAFYDITRRSIGTRSLYGGHGGLSARVTDNQTPNYYSQTHGSIRDRSMYLSNLGMRTAPRGSIDSVDLDVSADTGYQQSLRPGSFDDHSSIDQIIVGAINEEFEDHSDIQQQQPPKSFPRRQLLPSPLPKPQPPSMVEMQGTRSQQRQDESGEEAVSQLPPIDLSYIDPELRMPRNAKSPRSSQYGGQPQRRISLYDEHRPLLAPSSTPGEEEMLAQQMPTESGYAHFQRRRHTIIDLITWPLPYIPAVVLGLILNLLDGLSYGLIAFPVSIPIFDKFGPVGFSMYMLSTAVSQAVYSSGASAFRGANGSMLIEAIPFLYAMCGTIIQSVGEDNPDRVIATTMVAYASSTLITGLVFFLLGALRIGSLVDFFPRHILVGCIGGVGYFLFQTGMEVTSHLKLSWDWSIIKAMFSGNTLGLWSSSLFIALLLRLLATRYTHPLFVPLFFIAVPVIFYSVAAIWGISLDTLRSTGWIFQQPEAGVPFYYFYTLFDFSNTDWLAVWKAVPTMLGLAFFSILHVPINVPALAVSTNADKVDTNRELVAHGLSNVLSGMLGSFQNYLVYSNSLLFIRSGGDSNLAGMMLCAATVGVFLSGPTIIGYIPTMVVGALIFHLGLELLIEALVDTVGVVNWIEYGTIVSIVVAMAVLGFNEGIFLGILMACFFFVLLYSRRSAVRKAYTGSAVRSTVRRLYGQRRFLDGVCKQIQVMRLQGFMFFGTINGVEASIRRLLEQRQWQANPIRFLVLDFELVTSMDFSAGEAFIRVRKLLVAREIYMVISGVERSSETGRALRAAGVWNDIGGGEYIQTFPLLNDALEWCENVLLQYYYLHRAALIGAAIPQSYTFSTTGTKNSAVGLADSAGRDFGTSPRHAMVSAATHSTITPETNVDSPQQHPPQQQKQEESPALALLLQAFQDLDTDPATVAALAFVAPHFVSKRLVSGQKLWKTGGMPLGMYVVEMGTLRVFVENGSAEATESILPGTTLGELALVTGRSYHTTVVADGVVTLWELPKSTFNELCNRDPTTMLTFVRLALAYSAQGMDAITAYAFCAQ